MNCSRFRFLIQQSFDTQLSQQDERQVMAHLDSCDSCQRFQHQLDQVIQTAPDVPLPDECLPGNLEALAKRVMVEIPDEKPGFFSMLKALFSGGGGGAKNGKGKPSSKPRKDKDKSTDVGSNFPHVKRQESPMDMPAPRKKGAADEDDQRATSTRLRNIQRLQSGQHQVDPQSVSQGLSLGTKFGVNVPSRGDGMDSEAPLTLAESIRKRISDNPKDEAPPTGMSGGMPPAGGMPGGMPGTGDSGFSQPPVSDFSQPNPFAGGAQPGNSWNAPPGGSGWSGGDSAPSNPPSFGGDNSWQPPPSMGQQITPPMSTPGGMQPAAQAGGWGGSSWNDQPEAAGDWNKAPAPSAPQQGGWASTPSQSQDSWSTPSTQGGGWSSQSAPAPASGGGGWGSPSSSGGGDSWSNANADNKPVSSEGSWSTPANAPAPGGWGQPSPSSSGTNWSAPQQSAPAPAPAPVAEQGAWGNQSQGGSWASPAQPEQGGGWSQPAPGGWAQPATTGGDGWSQSGSSEWNNQGSGGGGWGQPAQPAPAPAPMPAPSAAPQAIVQQPMSSPAQQAQAQAADAWSEEGEQIQTGMWQAFTLDEPALGTPKNLSTAGSAQLGLTPPAGAPTANQPPGMAPPPVPAPMPAADEADRWDVPIQQRQARPLGPQDSSDRWELPINERLQIQNQLTEDRWDVPIQQRSMDSMRSSMDQPLPPAPTPSMPPVPPAPVPAAPMPAAPMPMAAPPAPAANMEQQLQAQAKAGGVPTDSIMDRLNSILGEDLASMAGSGAATPKHVNQYDIPIQERPVAPVPQQMAPVPQMAPPVPPQPQPVAQAAPPPVVEDNSPGGLFGKLDDRSMDKLFSENLGLSAEHQKPLGQAHGSQPVAAAPAPAPMPVQPQPMAQPAAPLPQLGPQPGMAAGVAAPMAAAPAPAAPAAVEQSSSSGLFGKGLDDSAIDNIFRNNLGVTETSEPVSARMQQAPVPPMPPVQQQAMAPQPAPQPVAPQPMAPQYNQYGQQPQYSAGSLGAEPGSAPLPVPGQSVAQPQPIAPPPVQAQPINSSGWGVPTAQPVAQPQPRPQEPSGLLSVDDATMDRIFADLGVDDAEVPRVNVKEAVQSIRQAAESPTKIEGISRLSRTEQPMDQGTGKIAQIGKFLLDQQDLGKIGRLAQEDLTDTKVRVLTLEAADEINKLLVHIGGQPGVIGSVIVGHDGILIANNLPNEFDAESIGVWSLGIYVNTTNSTRKMGHNHLHQLVAKSVVGYLVVADFGGGILVTVSNAQQSEMLIPLMRTITQLVAQ